jgi:hypothetical protein
MVLWKKKLNGLILDRTARFLLIEFEITFVVFHHLSGK